MANFRKEAGSRKIVKVSGSDYGVGSTPVDGEAPTLDADNRKPTGPPSGVGVVGTPQMCGACGATFSKRITLDAHISEEHEKDRSESVNTVIAFIRSGARSGDSVEQTYDEARDAIDRYVVKFTDGYK